MVDITTSICSWFRQNHQQLTVAFHIISSCFIHNKTAATKPLPIERALKTDILTILVVYQLHYSNTSTGDKGSDHVCDHPNDCKKKFKNNLVTRDS